MPCSGPAGASVSDHSPKVTSTARAAAGYAGIATLQRASGFIILILFTRILSPDQYGEITLLTTVGTLLTMLLTLGLEPRITYAYYRKGADLANYLVAAKQISVGVPVLFGASIGLILVVVAPSHWAEWAMQCVGSSALAAGTTYAYSFLRASRNLHRYVLLALSILLCQVACRVVFVAILDLGVTGWALSELVSGILALILGPRLARVSRSSRGPRIRRWQVLREGLPLVPHSLAQWGLALSDRLVLAVFVSTAVVGVYSAMYQFAAITSMMLNEINRAFMPNYAAHAPGEPDLDRVVLTHLRTTFALHATFVILGYMAIAVVLPVEYRQDDGAYAALTLGALAYGLYFVPMNGLTLVAGDTKRAPIISGIALALNLAVNVALCSLLGLWGAVLGTIVGYSCLVVIAASFEHRLGAINWRNVLRAGAAEAILFPTILLATILAVWSGPARLFAFGILIGAIVIMAARQFRGGNAIGNSISPR